jgi:tripartite-type tricarboxylate transporter receptor subunit TctC
MKISVVAVPVFVGTTTGALAQGNFPAKPVRIISSEAGGSGDLNARTIAQGLTSRWGRQVIVENRPGIVAIESLIHAQPDGYSLLFFASSLWIGPLLGRGSYDPIKDIAPITMATKSPNVLAVHPSVAVRSVKELIALAKAKPGTLNYGSGGTGSGPHIAAELFKSMAQVNIVRITFKGAGPAANAVVSGEVHMIFTTTGTVGPHVKSGRVRALAVTSAEPSALMPDLPTIASVLPGYEATQIQGVFAPARIPIALARRIQQDIATVLVQPEVKERFMAISSEVVGSTPEVLSQAMKVEIARLRKVIKEGGIKPE